MNDISTKVEKLDLEFILNNFLSHRLWDKRWIIFEYDGSKVTLNITSINVYNKTLSLRVFVRLRCFGNSDGYKNEDYNSVEIPYDLEHRNIPLFEKQIFGKALYGMRFIETRYIGDMPTYKEAVAQEQEYKEKLEGIAKEFLDEQGVHHEAIRQAYIDQFVNDSNIPSFTYQVQELYRYYKISKVVCMLALFMGLKDEYDTYKKYARVNGFTLGDIRKEVQKLRRELETDDFVDKAKENLLPILEVK